MKIVDFRHLDLTSSMLSPARNRLCQCPCILNSVWWKKLPLGLKSLEV